MRVLVHAAWLMLAFAATPAFSADATPPAPLCQAPEFRQMDFWLGDWTVAWAGGTGTIKVTREFDGCLIREVFTGSAPGGPVIRGESLAVYDALNKMWRMTGVGNSGGYFDMTGGPKADGTFVLQVIRVGREPRMLRSVFEKIEADSLTWRWQESDEGDVWTDQLVVQYSRVK